MKRFFVCFLTLATVLTVILSLYGCKSEITLFPYVSEVRRDILSGEKNGYTVKACLCQSETPKTEDGKAGTLIPFIEFTLSGEKTTAAYRLNFTQGGKNYSGQFETNPVSGTLTLKTEVDGINFKTLNVSLARADEITEITLNSILPENTASPETALKNAYAKSPSLFDSYRDENGVFKAEIQIRITVKNDKAYYFFGLADGSGYKAFLVDAKTCEILAVREVF